MPKRKPRTPSYRYHKPSGQAVVTLNGRDFYLGVYDGDASRAEASSACTKRKITARNL